MAEIAKHKTVNAPMAGDVVEHRFEYDFAVDGGDTGALDIMTAGDDLIIESAHLRVLTACGSTGSATLKWGVTGDDDRFCDTTQGAVANLDAEGDTILTQDVSGADATAWAPALPYLLPADAKLLQTIGTEDLNAGKIQYVIRVRKA